MKKAGYYSRNYIKHYLPSQFYKWRLKQIKRAKSIISTQEFNERLNFYVQPNKVQQLVGERQYNKNFSYQKPSTYYFDLKEYLYFFEKEFQFAYLFGDDTPILKEPTLIKARLITDETSNSILFKFNKIRHYKFIKDPFQFNEKKFQLVWRGAAHQPIRKLLLQQYQDKPYFDVGDATNRPEVVQWNKPYLSINQQLESKFILCPEGRDVATSLKWVFSSNSLCIMPKPKKESWFMEGTLQPNIHFAEVRDDLENLEEVMHYYNNNPKEALRIISNAQKHVQRFTNNDVEDLLCYEVLKRYAEITGQKNVLKFE